MDNRMINSYQMGKIIVGILLCASSMLAGTLTTSVSVIPVSAGSYDTSALALAGLNDSGRGLLIRDVRRQEIGSALSGSNAINEVDGAKLTAAVVKKDAGPLAGGALDLSGFTALNPGFAAVANAINQSGQIAVEMIDSGAQPFIGTNMGINTLALAFDWQGGIANGLNDSTATTPYLVNVSGTQAFTRTNEGNLDIRNSSDWISSRFLSINESGQIDGPATAAPERNPSLDRRRIVNAPAGGSLELQPRK
jgi:hypothetical protein